MAGLATALVTGTVGAAAAEEPVVAADVGWYTSMSLVAAGVPIGDPLATTTITSGDLPVGANAQEEHKRSYLRLDVPEGAQSVVIELPISENNATTFGVAGPILACGLVEPFFVTGGGELDDAPEVDCSIGVLGEPNAELTSGETTTAYTFDLTPLLPHWQSMGEAGVALVADVSEPQGFYQVTFSVQLFGVVGTAEVADEQTQPSEPPAPPVEEPSPPSDGAPPPSDTFSPSVPIGPADPFELPTADDVDAPIVAEPSEVAAPQAGGDPEQTPTMIAAPGKVALMPWFVGLLLGGGALVAVGRSLDPDNRPRSDLDELLGP